MSGGPCQQPLGGTAWKVVCSFCYFWFKSGQQPSHGKGGVLCLQVSKVMAAASGTLKSFGIWSESLEQSPSMVSASTKRRFEGKCFCHCPPCFSSHFHVIHWPDSIEVQHDLRFLPLTSFLIPLNIPIEFNEGWLLVLPIVVGKAVIRSGCQWDEKKDSRLHSLTELREVMGAVRGFCCPLPRADGACGCAACSLCPPKNG